MSLYSVQALLILGPEGRRIFAKYYRQPHAAPGVELSSLAHSENDQLKFEKKLHAKTNRVNGDITILDNHIILYKQMGDLVLAMVASSDENEILIQAALTALYDSIQALLDYNVDCSEVLECYDVVVLAIDETIDSGVILETEASVITSRVTRRASDAIVPNLDVNKGLRGMFDFVGNRLSDAVKQQFA